MSAMPWHLNFYSGRDIVMQAVWSNQLQAAAAEAALRESVLRSHAVSDEKCLAAADAAMEKGDFAAAVRLYLHLVRRHPPNESTATAARRLGQLKHLAAQKLSELMQELAIGPGIQLEPASPGLSAAAAFAHSSGSRWANTIITSLDKVAEEAREANPSEPDDGRHDEHIRATFQKFDRLIVEFGELPEIGPEIKLRVARLREKPVYAAVLKESAARILLARGKKFEEEDALCCAYWVYKGAKGLLPAPSAVQANQRFQELDQDPKVVAAAANCRELQECHKLYSRADHLAKVDRPGARKLFAEVVRRAPPESIVYQEAERRLQE